MHILQPSNSTNTEMQAVQDTYVRMASSIGQNSKNSKTYTPSTNRMDKLFIHITEYIHIRVCVWNEKKRILLHTTGMTPKHDIE